MSKQTLHYDTETKCSQNTDWNYMELYGTYMKSNGTNAKYWELTGTDRDKRNKITNKKNILETNRIKHNNDVTGTCN